MGHPDVIEAAVIGVPDDKWDERPLACVVLKEGSSTDVSGLKSFLAERVAKWWVPEEVIFLESLPVGGTGKVQKALLREKYGCVFD